MDIRRVLNDSLEQVNFDGVVDNIVGQYSDALYRGGVCSFAQCFITHDGYDRHGPKSNLYDLMIGYSIDVVDSNDDTRVIDTMYMVDTWHAEQWHTKHEVVTFYQTGGYRVNETSYNRLIIMNTGDNVDLNDYSGFYSLRDNIIILEQTYYDDNY